jgi:hypothetical protein
MQIYGIDIELFFEFSYDALLLCLPYLKFTSWEIKLVTLRLMMHIDAACAIGDYTNDDIDTSIVCMRIVLSPTLLFIGI